jgi:predicted porin
MAGMPVAYADDAADAQARLIKKVDDLERQLSELKSQLKTTAAQPQKMAAAPVPESLKTDQQGRAINDENPEGLTLFDNNKTKLTMYGLVEATLSVVSNQAVSPIPYGNGSQSIPAGGTPTGSYASTFGFQTSWFSGNRLGFDVQHDLGNGFGVRDLKAMAKLETEFELPSGSFDTSNTLFNRDAWLGFYSPDIGKVTFGRQNTLTRDFTQSWGDPYGTAAVTLREGGWTNVNNFKQLIFYSGSGDGTRMDSGLVWKQNFGPHWVAGLGHSFGFQGAGGSGGLGPGMLYGSITPGYSGGGQGGAVPGDPKNGATNEASIAYNGLRMGDDTLANVNYSYNTVSVDDLKQTSNQIGGNMLFGNKFRVNAGYVHYAAQQGVNNAAGTRTDDAYTISASLLLGKTDYALGYQTISVNHAGFIGGGTGGINMLPFISTAPNLSMLNAVANNVASGRKNTVYGSIMYHWDRQTDFYLAGDVVTVDGGVSFPDAANNGTNLSGNPAKGVAHETEVAAGVRLKF